MIRKAIIVVLTLGAVGTTTLWAISFAFPHGDFDPPTIGLQSRTLDRTTGWVIQPDGLMLIHTTRWGRKRPLKEWHHSHLGFSTQGFLRQGEWFVRGVELPIWFPIVVLATYPTIAFIRGPLRRHRRRRNGQCLRCGYSLEGNVTGVCPECGVTA